MAATLTQTLRSRSFAVGVHTALWLLLILVIIKVGGKAPDFRDSESSSTAPRTVAPIAKMVQLFEPAQWPGPLPSTEGSSPFFTRYFVPVASPTPPPPTTKKIEVTYQGYFETSDGPRNAVIKVADVFTVVPVGGSVATIFFVGEASMQSLTLTNPTAPPTILPLNSKKEIEVPVK
jgi:hypothetical protein